MHVALLQHVQRMSVKEHMQLFVCLAAYAKKKADLAEERKRREAEREAAKEARRQAMRDYMEHNFLEVSLLAEPSPDRPDSLTCHSAVQHLRVRHLTSIPCYEARQGCSSVLDVSC